MITIEKSRSWRGLAILAGVVVAAGAAYWALAPGNDGASGQSGSGAGGGLWPGWSSVGASSAPATAASGQGWLTQGQPQGVSEEDLQSLESALKKQPNAKAEAVRIVNYLRYQKDFERWQNLDEQKDARQRHQLAENLMTELPDRLKAGEFTLMEAALMGAVLVADLESDEARRTQRVEAWQAKIASLVPNFNDETQMAAVNKETEFMRRRASAFSDWQDKKDPSDRSPAKLSQAMEEVNRLYNTGGSQ